MLEFYVFSAIAGLGLMLNNRRSAVQDASPSTVGARLPQRPKIASSLRPSMNNVYHANDLRRVENKEREAAARATAAARNPKHTGVIPRTAGLDPITRTHADYHASSKSTQPTLIESPLTGLKIPVEEFTHNNMLPFFGSRVTQNMNHDTASLNMDRLNGGVNRLAEPKKEIAPMFEPQMNVGNVNGMNGQVDLMKDRIVAPKARNNEFPIAKQNVGPGIGNFGWKPQADVYLKSREHVMPKTVDELRAASNPKSTGYEGRVVAGQEKRERGCFSRFGKNRPRTTVRRKHEDNLVTTGAFLKQRRRPDVVEAKPTKRPSTHVAYTGPAMQAQGKGATSRVYPSRAPSKRTLRGPQFNPSGLTAEGRGSTFDHGRGSIMVYANERDVTGKRTHQSNVTSIIKALVAPVQDVFRTSKKEFMVDAPENEIGARPQIPSKPTTYDPDAPLRTTVKETNLHDTMGTGSIRGGALKSTVYDPDDIARTTIRETTSDAVKHGSGAIKGGALKSVVYDPDSIARTTTKETTLSEAPRANMRRAAQKGVAYDPDDIARTTTKQTTLAEAPHVNVRRAVQRGAVYDPEDVARTTTKQTTLAEAPHVNVRRAAQKGAVYDPEDVARTTTKQTTLSEAPHVNVRRAARKGVAYDPDAVARTTTKETTLAEAPRANMRRAAQKGVAYDPDAVARTTVKETTHFDGRGRGAVQGGVRRPQYRDPDARAKTTTKETLENSDKIGEQRHRNLRGGKLVGQVKDPDDKAKTTMKETTVQHSRTGNVEALEGRRGGYLATEYKAPHTQKETLHGEYVGGANTGSVQSGGGGGYKVANPVAKETQKQTTSQHEYYGIGADQGAKAPISHEDVRNAVMNETRELILEERSPTDSGPKVFGGPESMNVRGPSNELPNDFEDRFSRGKRAAEAEGQADRVDTCPPSEVQHRRHQYGNSTEERLLDAASTSALRTNPFAMRPLHDTTSSSSAGKREREYDYEGCVDDDVEDYEGNIGGEDDDEYSYDVTRPGYSTAAEEDDGYPQATQHHDPVEFDDDDDEYNAEYEQRLQEAADMATL
jgi:hypothetical protein